MVRRLLPLLLGAGLLACAPVQQAGPVGPLPAVQSSAEAARDLGPHRAGTEWWYVSSSLPDAGLALHWALFKVELLGRTLYVSHTAITDLKTGQVQFVETSQQAGASAGGVPLVVTQDGTTLRQTADGFTLQGPQFQLNLSPQGPFIRHPDSGLPQFGVLAYQSLPNLALSGTVRGQPVQGQAWLDHQWGGQQPGQGVYWDWMGLHTSDGGSLMLYRLRDAAGQVQQLYGTRVRPNGQPQALSGLEMTPGRVWTSGTGRTYTLGWQLRAEGLDLTVDAPHDAQELQSRTTRVNYWEGPVQGSGTLDGTAVTVNGMGEFLSSR
ncbi:lipocalin family protein [Deinococcus sonorensis]|uniref:Lipocalin family protein n=2 Tax=Deinococcus sonorensis TaxID=309891 RepID=A0AAU7UBN3_9DEIO